MALAGAVRIACAIVIEVRQATADDAEELIRLRAVMLTSMHGLAPQPGEWLDIAVKELRDRLAAPQPTLAAFVVAAGDASLAACALGTIETRLGNPANPSGRVGYVFNVVTEP